MPACGHETAKEWLNECVTLVKQGKHEEAIHFFDESHAHHSAMIPDPSSTRLRAGTGS
jgi:hypothetical protein